MRLLLMILGFLIIMEVGLRIAGLFYVHKWLRQVYEPLVDTPGTVTVVALGESSTGGLWVEPDKNYPSQLQHLLEEKYPDLPVRVIVPYFTGQNTSQMANRIESVLDTFEPRLMIIMAGVNNQWSLAENNVEQYLPILSIRALRVRLTILLSQVRVYRVLRYFVLAFVNREESEFVQNLANTRYPWGGAELTRYPPPAWIDSYGQRHPELFRKAWRDDLDIIITAAKNRDTQVLLMTYHLLPEYLPASEFIQLAEDHRLPLARNDLSFEKLNQAGRLGDVVLHDRWHPSPAGYGIIARNAFEAIVHNRLLERDH